MPKYQYMDLEEFKTSGLLQECNRQFLHPLGISLSLSYFKDGEVRLFVIDKREEKPEGCTWIDFGIEKSEAFRIRAQHIINQQQRVGEVRQNRYGWIIEPINSASPPASQSDDEPIISIA